ncbi:MAG: hypothetical protein LCI02_07930 [Proteobacteria bacterium]|nr:hypothetical protein [Pseudomonadota bacterium]
MNAAFHDVQRIVLVGGGSWQAAQQLVIGFAEGCDPLHFLQRLMQAHPITAAQAARPALQLSLGFSRRGLERARVPAHVLACFAARAPAFHAGAALRAASHAGQYGDNAPAYWDGDFGFTTLDAVLSLHATAAAEAALDDAVLKIKAIAADSGAHTAELPRAQRLYGQRGELRVHFGLRDGLSRIGINGCTDPKELGRCKPTSMHEAGEFVLGHPQNSGANPWLSTDGRQVWPKELRVFFHNGSFGVLHQVEQYVDEFEAFITEAVREAAAAGAEGLGAEAIRAKLCGRSSEGRPAGLGAGTDPRDDFDYADDVRGEGCPFGAHTRRMNARLAEPGATPAQAHDADQGPAHSHRRPLLRRGMPYGRDAGEPCGLIGQFFCASIEDQFEHLLGQWADRVPLGSPDRGGARDPLIGAHQAGDGGFEIPLPGGRSLLLHGLRPFTRTRGTAYLFYPSLTALQQIAEDRLFAPLPEDE